VSSKEICLSDQAQSEVFEVAFGRQTKPCSTLCSHGVSRARMCFEGGKETFHLSLLHIKSNQPSGSRPRRQPDGFDRLANVMAARKTTHEFGTQGSPNGSASDPTPAGHGDRG
jgi:hypothetical protein